MSGMMAGMTATPMWRTGSWATKSASQRLWARLPATAWSGSLLSPPSPVPNGEEAIRPVPSTSASGNSTSAATPSVSRIALRASESNAAVRPPSPSVSASHSARNFPSSRPMASRSSTIICWCSSNRSRNSGSR